MHELPAKLGAAPCSPHQRAAGIRGVHGGHFTPRNAIRAARFPAASQGPSAPAACGEGGGASRRYRALDYAEAGLGTWAILDRDGAGRAVDPYLSSLGGGEMGTG